MQMGDMNERRRKLGVLVDRHVRRHEILNGLTEICERVNEWLNSAQRKSDT